MADNYLPCVQLQKPWMLHLAADGVDIIPAEIDGTVADVDANKN
jgi:hypothetical protein